MPFIEGIFNFIVIVVGLGLCVLAIGYASIALGAIVGFIFLTTLFIGWIPVFMCASDPDMLIQWENATGFLGFFERWAFLAMLVYSVMSVAIVVLALARPDPDGLPPAWKFIALFYVPPAAKIARAATARGASFEPAKFIAAVDDTPSTITGKRMDARGYKKETAHVKAAAERTKEATELAKASIKLAQLRAEQEALEEFMKKHGK